MGCHKNKHGGTMRITSTVIAAFFLSSASAFQHHGGIPMQQHKQRVSARHMKSSTSMESEEGTGTGRRFEATFQPAPYNDRSQMTSLSVATLQGAASLPGRAEGASIIQRLNLPDVESGNIDAIGKVLSASLLITGNTVGSSMFVLPETVGGVGMVWGSSIFFGIYLYNLISGLLLADVAINLHESSECDVPSSFKDFVDTALKSETAGTAMAGASLISNSCFLAFGTVHAGSLLANTFPGFGLEPIMGAGAFAATIALFSLTQTNKGLEKITNVACLVLFSSFASLLLPSMANVSDPVGTFLAPGTNTDGFAAAVAAAVPLILSSLTYQNIVPSITKLLDFDRTKSTIAVAMGSFIPMAMYISWCFVALGGGLDSSTASGAGAAALTAFTASALIGSCVAAVMSLAEEYESIISSMVEEDDSCPVKSTFSVPAVAASMAPPVAVALAFAKDGDLTGALHFNGAVITPFLYGLLPIILFQSMQKKEDEGASSTMSLSSLPQVLLGAGTVGALGQEIMQDIANLPNMMA